MIVALLLLLLPSSFASDTSWRNVNKKPHGPLSVETKYDNKLFKVSCFFEKFSRLSLWFLFYLFSLEGQEQRLTRQAIPMNITTYLDIKEQSLTKQSHPGVPRSDG